MIIDLQNFRFNLIWYTFIFAIFDLKFDDHTKIYVLFASSGCRLNIPVKTYASFFSFHHFILASHDKTLNAVAAARQTVISKVYEEPFFQTYELLSCATNKIVILPVHFLHYDFTARFTTRTVFVNTYGCTRVFVYVFPCIYICMYVRARAYMKLAYKMTRSMRMVVDISFLSGARMRKLVAENSRENFVWFESALSKCSLHRVLITHPKADEFFCANPRHVRPLAKFN